MACTLNTCLVVPLAACSTLPERRSETSARKAARVVHMTDFHVQPELRAQEGMTAALHHAQLLKPSPDLIITGGDLVMDAFAATEARTRIQWDIFLNTLRSECRLPVEHCIGNHDVWGWDQTRSGTLGTEAQWGKRWAEDVLGVQRFRSFNRFGWHFIILDSTHRKDQGFVGLLDDEQYAWLENDLAVTDTSTPVVVVSHIPLVSVCAFFNLPHVQGTDWNIPGFYVHTDAWRLRDLFIRYPNVRLCLSGHVHQLERIDYQGVVYFCNGAVCGNWWHGPYHNCPEGYAIIDLYDDGTFEHAYVAYGWTADQPTTQSMRPAYDSQSSV